jgi:hypothetical protein
MIFSKNNHINYWYNNDPSCLTRTSEYDILNFSIGSINRAPLSFKEECIIAAKEIHQTYPDIHIGLTGGLDSNICLDSFMSAGITPGIFIIKFPNGLNSFDADYAEAKCTRLGIKPIVIEFDPLEFISTRLMVTVEKYQIYSLYQAIHIDACKTLSVPHISVDEIELRRDVAPEIEWCFVKKEDQDMCWRRYASIDGIPALNNFYTWSPELMLSFLQLPTIKKLANNELIGKLAWNSSKYAVYTEGGFGNVPNRPKTWGVEKIYNEWENSQADIDQQVIGAPRSCYVGYNELITALEHGDGQWKYI